MENKNVSEELTDWQQIKSPFSSISAKLINENNNSSVIKEDFFSESSVFPPGNHEDLQISTPEDDHQHLQEQGPNDTPCGDWGRRSIRPHLGVMQTGIFWIVGRIRIYVNCRVGLWSLAWIAFGAAATLMVSFFRRRVLIWRQRRMQIGSSREGLMNLIREKDKKIEQLLLQIARMNELLAERRKVRVVRVK